MLKQRFTAAAAAADAQWPTTHPTPYEELSYERQKERVDAYVDSILAAPRNNGLVEYLLTMARTEETTERGRRLAFDAMIRVFEASEATRAASADPDIAHGMPTGPQPVWLSAIDGAVPGWGNPFAGEKPGGPGRAYVREVFDTWEPPPPWVADIEGSGIGHDRTYILRHPWCQAGQLLFGDAGGEVNRAYGIRGEKYYRYPGSRRPPPPKRKLSEDAARWWNLCWDGRPWGDGDGW